MNKGIGKSKLGVLVLSDANVAITEYVKNGRAKGAGYRAAITTTPLTKKQALALGLLLIKAAQQ